MLSRLSFGGGCGKIRYNNRRAVIVRQLEFIYHDGASAYGIMSASGHYTPIKFIYHYGASAYGIITCGKKYPL
jgi:hypothetical protein